MTDPETELKRIIKETGEVHAIYGGFEIKVLKPTLFPWHKLLNQLFEIGQKVWVEKKEGKIYIVSEPNIQ
jgi:hypothetical protein